MHFWNFFMFPSGPKNRETRFRCFWHFLWLYSRGRLGKKNKKYLGWYFFFLVIFFFFFTKLYNNCKFALKKKINITQKKINITIFCQKFGQFWPISAQQTLYHQVCSLNQIITFTIVCPSYILIHPHMYIFGNSVCTSPFAFLETIWIRVEGWIYRSYAEFRRNM